MTRTVLHLYCNACGRLFAASETTRRVCSRACTIRLRSMAPWPSHQYRQDMILAELRTSPGRWRSSVDLAAKVYGCGDRPSVLALRNAIRRLANRPDLPGLVIDYRRAAPGTSGRHRDHNYRLTHDVVSVDEAAS